ncbi:MAG: slipin family protein [Ammonifex sp.]|jgi:regulator of protease activity HflC (stomatin/prohibitin superfamily)|nr:MAG: slipin family protein [Ammonifex sp.]
MFSFMVTIIILGIFLLASAVKIVQEYERGVIFRLGRCVGARGPGLFLLIPIIERMRKVDLRVVTMEVPTQEVITRDNVTVKVNAVVYFRIINPVDAVIKVIDPVHATSQLAQTTLRSVLGQSELDELLSQREAINQRLQQIIDEGTEPWGVKVGLVEVRDVELPGSMQRAMAAQAEAERERRAKIIHAEGELQASEKLSEAGRVIAREPVTVQLRYLQTLREIGANNSTTIVFPLPLDLIKPLLKIFGSEGDKPAS